MAKVKHTIQVADGGFNRCNECGKIIKQGKKVFYKKGIMGMIFSGGCCSLQCFNAKYN